MITSASQLGLNNNSLTGTIPTELGLCLCRNRLFMVETKIQQVENGGCGLVRVDGRTHRAPSHDLVDTPQPNVASHQDGPSVVRVPSHGAGCSGSS